MMKYPCIQQTYFLIFQVSDKLGGLKKNFIAAAAAAGGGDRKVNGGGGNFKRKNFRPYADSRSTSK
jgi:hypothetical protein